MEVGGATAATAEDQPEPVVRTAVAGNLTVPVPQPPP